MSSTKLIVLGVVALIVLPKLLRPTATTQTVQQPVGQPIGDGSAAIVAAVGGSLAAMIKAWNE